MSAPPSAAAAIRLSSARPKRFSEPFVPYDHYLHKPVKVGPSFEKQTTRNKAVYGKLLNDVAMTKMLMATDWNQGGRDWYDGAADSMLKPLITSRRPASTGVKFEKQITRKQAVCGKLLTDVAMTRMLLGADWSQGGDSLASEPDSFLNPPPTRKRPNVGQHRFNRQIGRVAYHVAGMRGAPAKPGLGEKVVGGALLDAYAEEASSRASSAPGAGGAKGLTAFATLTDVPQRPRLHVSVPDMSRQLPRARWTQQPMRIAN